MVHTCKPNTVLSLTLRAFCFTSSQLWELGHVTKPPIASVSSCANQECGSYNIIMGLSGVLNKVKYIKYLGSIVNPSENTVKFLVASSIIMQASYDGVNLKAKAKLCLFLLFLLLFLLLLLVILRALVVRLEANSSHKLLSLDLAVTKRPLLFHPHVP